MQDRVKPRLAKEARLQSRCHLGAQDHLQYPGEGIAVSVKHVALAELATSIPA